MEIKFRAWDKLENQMARSVTELLFNSKGLYGVRLDHLGFEFRRRIKDIELMQYTGLKGKNGKEIYEGDIIGFEDMGEEGYEYKEGFDFINRAKVVFENGRWELDNFISDNSGVMEEMGNCHEDFISAFVRCEVIGNIFENPELLEGKTC